MSDIPDQISGGLSLAQQLVDLLSGTKTLFGIRRPEPNQTKKIIRKLRQDLGEWAEEAYPKRKKCWHRPILRANKFIEHLKQLDGRCKPEGACTVTFAWAKLLFALNIKPGTGVVTWEQQSPLFDPAMLTLEMEGPVLWHILNLYRLYDKADPKTGSPTSRYDLSFGALSYNVDQNKLLVTFEAGELTECKMPFQYNPPFCSLSFEEDTGYLRFESQTVMTTYLATLNAGISDPNLTLPSPSTPTAKRLQELVRVLQTMKEKRDLPTDRPFLVTHQWLAQAGRIYSRVTCDGSDKPTLPMLLVSSFEDNGPQDAIKSLNQRYGERVNGESKTITWRTEAEDLLKGRCLLPRQSLQLVWRPENENESSSSLKNEISRLIRENFDSILQSFKDSPAPSVSHTLASVPAEAEYLLAYPRRYEIQNRPGIALEFTSSHEHWTTKSQVQC